MRDNTFILVIEILGLVAFATSGALAAFKKDLDLVGFIILATLTGIGGGTTRDIILDRQVFWLHDTYLYSLNICFITAFVCYVISKFIQKRENIVNFFDALGLSLFAIDGYFIAYEETANVEIAIVMGTITACCGGLLRDITLNRRAFLLRGELYATLVVIGLIVLYLTNLPILAFTLIFTLRLLTISYHWKYK